MLASGADDRGERLVLGRERVCRDARALPKEQDVEEDRKVRDRDEQGRATGLRRKARGSAKGTREHELVS